MLVPYKSDWTLFKLPLTLPHPCRGPRGPFHKLPRHMLVIVCFCKPCVACGLQVLLTRVLARKESQFKQVRKVMFRRSLCRLGLHLDYPCYVGTCMQSRGHSSAELPRTFREIRRQVWSSWLVGNCSSGKRCVSRTAKPLCFYCNRFSVLFHAN